MSNLIRKWHVLIGLSKLGVGVDMDTTEDPWEPNLEEHDHASNLCSFDIEPSDSENSDVSMDVGESNSQFAQQGYEFLPLDDAAQSSLLPPNPHFFDNDSAWQTENEVSDARGDVRCPRVHVEKFAQDLARTQIIGSDVSENFRYGGELNNAENIYKPFHSEMDWEFARWVKQHGIRSTALNYFLSIRGVGVFNVSIYLLILTSSSA